MGSVSQTANNWLVHTCSVRSKIPKTMLNKAQIIGNVGNDPEFKDFGTSKVANFTVATTERAFTTKSGQEAPERTEWHRVVVWGGLARVVEGYVKKGTRVYVEGKMRTREYTDQAGVQRRVSEIHADNLILLSTKPETQSPDAYQSPEPQGESNSDGLPF